MGMTWLFLVLKETDTLGRETEAKGQRQPQRGWV